MKVKVTIPSSLNEIKVSQYQKFLKVTKDSEDADFVNRMLVAIFCNIPDKVIDAMTKKSFDSIVEDLSELMQGIQSQPLIRTVRYEGLDYGFIPNLDEITVGEQADLSNYIQDWQTMDKALGVMFRPITNKRKEDYLIEEYKASGVALDLPLDVALGAYFFFLNLAKDLLSCIPNYIQALADQDKSLQNLDINGVGINQSMESLREIFSDLKMSLN